jgi:outer membrane protein assembly factor BamE
MRLSPLVLALVPFLAGGCGWSVLSPYRMEIQQGNYLGQEQVSQLRTGMTRDQVRFLLGTPLVADIFNADRWDYVYMRRRANASRFEERRISLFFVGDKLDRVEGDVVPSGAAASAEPEAATR